MLPRALLVCPGSTSRRGVARASCPLVEEGRGNFFLALTSTIQTHQHAIQPVQPRASGLTFPHRRYRESQRGLYCVPVAYARRQSLGLPRNQADDMDGAMAVSKTRYAPFTGQAPNSRLSRQYVATRSSGGVVPFRRIPWDFFPALMSAIETRHQAILPVQPRASG